MASALRRRGELADGWIPGIIGPARAAVAKVAIDQAAGTASRQVDPDPGRLSMQGLGYDVAVENTPWLDDEEQRAWRSLIVASNRLKATLGAELVADHGLAFGDYEVLVVLSEAPERRMRMSELAEELCLSPSGLTRRLDRLTLDGLVAREQCPADRRGSFAVLTAVGFTRLEAAAPDHVRGVREHLLDHLDRRQMRVLGEALGPVAEACPWRTSSRRRQVA